MKQVPKPHWTGYGHNFLNTVFRWKIGSPFRAVQAGGGQCFLRHNGLYSQLTRTWISSHPYLYSAARQFYKYAFDSERSDIARWILQRLFLFTALDDPNHISGNCRKLFHSIWNDHLGRKRFRTVLIGVKRGWDSASCTHLNDQNISIGDDFAKETFAPWTHHWTLPPHPNRYKMDISTYQSTSSSTSIEISLVRVGCSHHHHYPSGAILVCNVWRWPVSVFP